MNKLRTLFIFTLVFCICLSSWASAQKDELEQAKALNQQIVEYYKQGRYEDAIPLALEMLAIVEKVFGPEDPETAQCLINLASMYHSMGDYAHAEPLYQRSLAIREKTLGPDHPRIADGLNNLALLYESIGDYTRAVPLYQRSLAIREKALGPDHPDTAQSLNNLALLYKTMGDYARAEPMYHRALAVIEKSFGPEHPHTAISLNNLAALYHTVGDYSSAEPLYKRALAIDEKALGPEHPDTATDLNNLALLYEAMGDYARAEPLYKRALDIAEKTLGPNHPDTAQSLNNLALLYKTMGDYARAEPLYQRALAVYEKTLGLQHPNTAATLNNLAQLHESLGDYARAESLYQRSLAIWEKAFGPDHPDTALSLNNLAALYKSTGDYARAEPLYQKALAIREKSLGQEHPDTAQSLHNLALLYKSTGDYARAEPLYKKSLAIWEKTLGQNHPTTAVGLNNLASLVAARGDPASAHKLYIKSQKISAALIDQVMGFTSEDQKSKFLATQQSELEAALGLVAFHLAEDKDAVREILDVWLGRKGTILETQRRYQEALLYSNAPEAMVAFQELAGVRADLSKLLFGGPGRDGSEVYRKKIAALEIREKELEAKLSRLSQAFARQKRVQRADTVQVARQLPQGSVLVDFAQIQPFNFQAKRPDEKWSPAHYLAFVLHAGNGDRVFLVDLGETAPIDQAVAELKASMTTPLNKKAEAAGEKLYKMVFARLEKELDPARDIFISPDGNLNIIPFEVLRRPDGKYLIEDYSFNYLASGRDLIGYDMVRTKAGPPLIMGDPDFDSAAPGTPHAPSFSRSIDMRDLHFDRLPGTLDEARAVRRILGTGDLYTGHEASEKKLFEAQSPRILHLATHGFFLTNASMMPAPADDTHDASTRGRVVLLENPLLRSGLALAGANRALSVNDRALCDGLVTAEKVLSLQLQGTELVVLSACETGVGKARAGEGVYGLRRAFTQAGAAGLVMSMWPVPDLETKELMIHFYGNLKKGMNPRLALRTAALSEKEIVRDRYGHTHPLFWGGFVYMGDPGKSTVRDE